MHATCKGQGLARGTPEARATGTPEPRKRHARGTPEARQRHAAEARCSTPCLWPGSAMIENALQNHSIQRHAVTLEVHCFSQRHARGAPEAHQRHAPEARQRHARGTPVARQCYQSPSAVACMHRIGSSCSTPSSTTMQEIPRGAATKILLFATTTKHLNVSFRSPD